MRLADAAVKDPDTLRFNNAQRRWNLPGTTGKADADDDDDDVEAPAVAELEKSKLPTKPNAVNLAVYGQILLAAKSYQSALCKLADVCAISRQLLTTLPPLPVYLLQAYDYAPDDPMVCLSLAIASVGRAMQRQSDNRHHLITQVDTSLPSECAGEPTDDLLAGNGVLVTVP